MEVITNTTPIIYFDGPGESVMVTSAILEYKGAQSGLSVVKNNNTYSVTMPFLDSDGVAKLTWEFLYNNVVYKSVEEINIATPYISERDLKSIFSEGSDEERKNVEAAVRHIINAYCGQSFGRAVKTVVVPGQGQDGLRLPEHLLKVTNFSTLEAELDPRGLIIAGEGWYLKKKWLEEIGPLYNDAPYWGVEGRPGGVIYAPGATNRPTQWERDYPFTITGEWGYYSVPEPVKQAAKLLVNDYACMEIAWRDRYLESIKAADWRLQFNDNAWARTGNVRADQLLSDYVIMDWAVL